MTPLDLVEDRLRARVGKVVRRGDTITAQCPAHPDRNPSLSVAVGVTRDIVLTCHAGCTPDAVMEALELAWTDLGDGERPDTEIACYVYTDGAGRPLYRVHRMRSKRFWQDRMTPHGEWVPGLQGVPRVLYRLPEVVAAVADRRTVWVAEGEKDVDRLRAEGVVATCNSGGAGSFKPEHADVLAGANVVVVADRDEPGWNHARTVRDLLVARGCTVRTVAAVTGKDASDHFGAGLPLEQMPTVDLDRDQPVDEPWPDPIPLTDADGAPSFPVEVLPDWIADQVEQVADELQCPVDLPAMLALVALAMIHAGRWEVHVRGTWREQVNLYVVVCLPPGAGKSPAFRLMLGALERYEAELAEAKAFEIERMAQKRRMAEKAMKRAEEKGSDDEAKDALLQLQDTPEPPAVPRLMIDDATPEALVEVLGQQNGRLALVSTEGGPFEMMSGRYSDKAALEPYLQAWSGDTIRVDRIGRGSRIINHPALTIGLTVQPRVIEALSERPELAGRGLTARFMYAVPDDHVGHRNLLDQPDVDPGIADRYNHQLLTLARRHHEGHTSIVTVHPDALHEFMGWRQGLEHRRRPDGDLRALAEWTTKLESSVARVAGLFALADDTTVIDLATMRRALAVGHYWLAHAKVVHDMWGSDERVAQAGKILHWAAERRLATFTVRDVYASLRKVFPTAESTREALLILTERGWIRPLFDGPLVVGKRGKDSPSFALHPSALWISTPHARDARDARRGIKKDFSLSLKTRGETGEYAHDAHDAHEPQHGPSATTPPFVTESEEWSPF